MCRAAVETTYLDVRRLIGNAVAIFMRRYGGSFEDHMADASLWFMDAYRKWDGSRSSFVTYVRGYIYWQLLEKQRQYMHANRRIDREVIYLDELVGPTPPAFDLGSWLGGLSDEARTVARLVFETPMDIHHALAVRGSDSAGQYRTAIRRYLKDLGWSAAMIAASFSEIRRALR